MSQQGNLIGLMIREGLISFVRIDRSVFAKTAAEKLKVRNIASAHNRAVRKLGYDPKKVFNPIGIPL